MSKTQTQKTKKKTQNTSSYEMRKSANATVKKKYLSLTSMSCH